MRGKRSMRDGQGARSVVDATWPSGSQGNAQLARQDAPHAAQAILAKETAGSLHFIASLFKQGF